MLEVHDAALAPAVAPAPAAARILAMLRAASIPAQAQAEQRLIAAVCTRWQRLGHASLLLDGSQSESESNNTAHGLYPLLQESPWRARARLHPAPQAETPAVLPARDGLRHLARAKEQAQGQAKNDADTPLHILQHHLPCNSVALLYADAALLAPLLQPHTPPLLLLGAPQSRPGAQGGHVPWPHMIEIYRHLKQLARHGTRRCLLAVPTLPSPAPCGAPAPEGGDFQHWQHSQTCGSAHVQDALRHQAQIHALCQCAHRHLGLVCIVLPLRAEAGDMRPDDLRQLARHWLAPGQTQPRAGAE